MEKKIQRWAVDFSGWLIIHADSEDEAFDRAQSLLVDALYDINLSHSCEYGIDGVDKL